MPRNPPIRIKPGQHGSVSVAQKTSRTCAATAIVRRLDGESVTVSATGTSIEEARHRLDVRIADVLAGRKQTVFPRKGGIVPGNHGHVQVTATRSGTYIAAAKVRPIDGLTVRITASSATEQEARERLDQRIADVLAGRPLSKIARRSDIVPGHHWFAWVTESVSGTYVAATHVQRIDGSTVRICATAVTEEEARELLEVRIVDTLTGRENTETPPAMRRIDPGSHGIVKLRRTSAGTFSAVTRIKMLDGSTTSAIATGSTEQEARERLEVRIADTLAGREMTKFPQVVGRRSKQGPRVPPGDFGVIQVTQTPHGTPMARTRLVLPNGTRLAVSAAGVTEEEAVERLKRRMQERLAKFENGWRPMKRTRIPVGEHGTVTIKAGPFRVNARASVRLTEEKVVVALVSAPTEDEARRDLAVHIKELLAGRAHA